MKIPLNDVHTGFLAPMLQANNCGAVSETLDPAKAYPAAAGYVEGERFATAAYRGSDGNVRVAVTVMKNMPHGAINDESRACWEQPRHFRRQPGERGVEYLL